MNERIKQITGQVLDELVPETWVALGYDKIKEIQNRTAELIVQECAKICIEQNVSNLDLDVIRESGKFTLQDLATKSCGENLSKQIKQHFYGVEE
jgi:hypothetical protein